MPKGSSNTPHDNALRKVKLMFEGPRQDLFENAEALALLEDPKVLKAIGNFGADLLTDRTNMTHKSAMRFREKHF